MSIAQPAASVSSYKAGFIERAVTKFLMRQARVAAVQHVSANFRLITLEGDELKRCSWAPGDKIQIKLAAGLITRTYTPISWDSENGVARILALIHGDTPGSQWAAKIKTGDTFALVGPRSSISLNSLQRPSFLFGDETSFGLAVALQRTPDQFEQTSLLFEVSSVAESTEVLRQLGVPNANLVERLAHDQHLEQAEHLMHTIIGAHHCDHFVFSGKASSIQHLKGSLKTRGIPASTIQVKAYWAPGKKGLD
jgi:ferric-chelate reductase (NADPH)